MNDTKHASDIGQAPGEPVATTVPEASAKQNAKQNFPSPAAQPTQAGPEGIAFDFNDGARVTLPRRDQGKWRIRMSDRDTGNILFQSEGQGSFVRSSKKYFVRIDLDIWALDESGAATPVFSHAYDSRDREVLIHFPVGTLGDTLGWFPYAARFAEIHGCKLTCALSALIIPLLRDAYPDIRMVSHQEAVEQKLAETAYATYCLGLFFDDAEAVNQPCDFRMIGLHRTAGYILGVDPTEAQPRIAMPADESRPIAEPYVCIAAKGSSQCKYWNNPFGWRQLIVHLKARGFKVVCIDQKPVHGAGLVWNDIPHGAEDETGHSLTEAARWLRHAEAFVGLSSGLSWLAWGVNKPVVMISGFSHPTTEFATPFRVINYHACNSCWNDPKLRFDHQDFLWCPRHAGTERQFECTKLITAGQVIVATDKALSTPEESSAR